MSESAEVVVHPQVMLQIADHYTNSQFLSSTIPYPLGLIVCENKDGRLELLSSFESIPITNAAGKVAFNSIFQTLLRQHQANYKNEVPIGWYIITDKDVDPELINQLQSTFEVESKGEPILVRCEYRFNDENCFKFFVMDNNSDWKPVEVSYQSELAERIALLQLQSRGSADSQISFTKNAYETLDKSLAIIQQYILDVKDKKAPFDAEIVRLAGTIAQWWTNKTPSKEVNDFIDQANVSLLSSLIAETITNIQAKLSK